MTGPVVRRLGRIECAKSLEAMREFTRERSPETPDEIWLCEHPPVYTQGVAGRPEHVLNPGAIVVLRTDRGGQVTYHGPGQVVAYALVDLKRLGIYVKEYVYRLEQSVVKTLESLGVTGRRVAGAPGIYVDLSDPFGHALRARSVGEGFAGLGKIAALGVKVSRHCTYHGVALNVAMDLSPFDGIHPCGQPGLRTIDLSTIGVQAPWDAVANTLSCKLAAYLSP